MNIKIITTCVVFCVIQVYAQYTDPYERHKEIITRIRNSHNLKGFGRYSPETDIHDFDIPLPITDTIKLLELRLDKLTKEFNIFKNENRKGQKGETGQNGRKGERGADGKQGIPGQQGLKGDTGVPGPAGIPGIQGMKGDKGEEGKKGDMGIMGKQGITIVSSNSRNLEDNSTNNAILEYN